MAARLLQRSRARLARIAIAASLLGPAGFAALPACYDVPKPLCGFRCGPEGACPDDYTCHQGDGRCHLNSAPPELVCGTVDAAIDAPDVPDAPGDGPDEPTDVPDPAIDAAVDPAIDAAVDPAIDAPIDPAE